MVSAPKKAIIALTTPINAPPAMKPEAMSVPRLLFALACSASLWRLTAHATKPPTTSGALSSIGINIPRAKGSAGSLIKVRIRAIRAPKPYKAQGVAPPVIRGLITAAIAFAWGATRAFSPVKPYVWFMIIITPATVAADTAVPTNFHVCCFLGDVPSQ